MKKFIRELLVMFICGLLISLCIFAFKTEHYVFGVILFGLILTVWMNSFTKESYKSELEWISSSLRNENELERIRQASRTYAFIQNCILDKRIIKGMNLKELQEIFKEIDPHRIANISEKKYTVFLYGYGYGIPTPRLILEIEDGKLVKWKSEQEWA